MGGLRQRQVDAARSGGAGSSQRVDVCCATHCETPAGAERRRLSAAEARLQQLVDAIEEARFCVDGAALYLRRTQGTPEETPAFQRYCRELDALRLCLRAYTRARAAKRRVPCEASTSSAAGRLLGTGALLLLALFSALVAVAPLPAQAQGPALQSKAAPTSNAQTAAHDADARALQFPQDFALALQAADACLAAHEAPRAEFHYRRAVALSDGAAQAHAGLGFALLAQGKRDEAKLAFQAALTLTPERADLKDALGKLGTSAAVQLSPSLVATGQAFSGSASRSVGLGTSLAIPALLWEHLQLSATYRLWTYQLASTSGTSTTGSTYFQQEGHFSAGYTAPGAAFALHYSRLDDGTSTVGRAHVAGLTARLSPGGDLLLDTSVSVYDDATIGRLALAYSWPLTPSLRLIPSLAVQRASRDTFAAASLSLAYSRPTWSAWLGGKLGEEMRPAYLGLATVANYSEHVLGGAWAGLSLALSPTLALTASYDLSRLSSTASSSLAHSLTLGLSWSFSRP